MARLLILTPQLPFPPHQGTTIRNFNLIAGLAPRHDIDLLSLVQPTDLAPARQSPGGTARAAAFGPAPRPAWRRLLTTISTPLPDMALRLAGVLAFQDTLLNLVQTTPYAVLQVEGIEMAPYVTWLQRQPAWASARQAGHLRLVFDDHNAETILQQRTALAASLALRPRLLILDEPTLGQDWQHLSRLMDFLTLLSCTGSAILLISHDYKLVHHYARRAILMEKGRVKAMGHLAQHGNHRRVAGCETIMQP